MLSIFKTTPSGLLRLDDFEPGAWIDLVSPTDEELSRVAETLNIPLPFLRGPLDAEEKSRVDIEDDLTHVIVDIPVVARTRRRAGLRHYPAGHVAAPRLLHHHLPAAEPHPGRVRAGCR